MPNNLDPLLVAPVDAKLVRGMLLVIPEYDAKGSARRYESMQFQFNPESVTRTRQGEWTSERARTATRQERSIEEGHRGGGLRAKSEVIELKLVFDATERTLREDSPQNILPELAFLERVALGGDEPMKTESRERVPDNKLPDEKKKASAVTGNQKGSKESACAKSETKPTYKTRIQGTAPSELLLVLGPRTFPVVLTTLKVEEQRFNPTLEPVRAVCECKFRVLEVQEVKHNKPAEVAFTELMRQRLQDAGRVEPGDSSRVSAIVGGLESA